MELAFKNIFTEYDDSLQKSLNIDPMGLSVIWTYFGQRIFNNKISSVALDIRSFNINLFNHFVIATLITDSSLNIHELFEKDKKQTIEKLLIVLENMIIWSWHESESNWMESQRKGLLGTSKALSQWIDGKTINININESFEKLELLKRQKVLGVNGRYKGSFVQIGFFTNNYDEYFNKDIFDETKLLIENNTDLKSLYDCIIGFFKDMKVEKIPKELYKIVFADTNKLAESTKAFWIDKLGFKTDEAKAIYDSVDLKNKTTLQEIFKQANKETKFEKLETILNLEPKLSYFNSLFQYLLFCDGLKVDEIENSYFKKLNSLDLSSEVLVATDSAKERLEQLSKIKDIKSIIQYHTEIMLARGHTPWLTMDEITNKIKVEISRRGSQEEVETKLASEIKDQSWIHNYYLWSVESIKRGLENEAL